MILSINNLSIISQETKKAKYQVFKSGINVVTSSGEIDGNWVGKSSLLRSIFHTLGADGLFSNKWEIEGKYLYLLDFNVDSKNYIMLRKYNLFKLYDSNMNSLFSVSDRGDLSKELTKLFNQEIFLKTREGSYRLASPVYNYLLNYIEQKNIKVSKFDSFNSLGEFPGYFEDLIYSHLGVRNDKSNSLREEQERLNKTRKELIERENTLNEMSIEVEKNGGAPVDIDKLRDKLSIHEEKYRELSISMRKHKKNLTHAYNAKVDLENILQEFDSLIKTDTREIKNNIATHKCQSCNSPIDPHEYYFMRVKHVDGLEIQRINVEDNLNKVKRIIENESEHYANLSKQLKKMENEIFNSSSEIKDGLKSLGLKEISNNIIDQILNIRSQVKLIDKDLEDIAKDLRDLDAKKKEVDAKYNRYFSELLVKYPINDIEAGSIQKASSKINVDGTHVNIAAVAWLCTLLKVKYEFNPNAVKYPIIFDTPNNANLDANNVDKIFQLLFENLFEGGQIITSLVGFRSELYKDSNINIIYLNNEKYQLLSQEDYSICKDKYNTISDFKL